MTRETRERLGGSLLRQWPLLCGILALPVFALFILAATLVSPGYSHTTDTISHLGGRGSPHPWIVNTGMFLYGLMVLAFASGLGRHLGATPGGKLLSALLAINALSVLFAVLLGITWGEAPLEGSILGGSLHEAATRVGFTSLTLAILLFPALIWGNPQWRRARWVLQGLALLMLVSGITFVLEGFPDYSGVVQRTYFAMCGIWLQVVAVQMMRKAPRLERGYQ